jgi:hypothetical protein
MSRWSGAQLRHTMPPWWGATTLNHHDCFFPREGHRVAPARVLTEFRTLGRGPRDYEPPHHVTVIEPVPDGVHVVWASLLEEFLEVIGRRPSLMLVTMHGSHDMHHARAAHLPVVAIIVVDCGHSPMRTLLVPPLTALYALPSALDGTSLPLLGVTSLLYGGRQNLVASLMVAYWEATLHSSSVVYLKMSLYLP